MSFGIDLAFLIPIDFWDYMWYAVFFVMLTAIPATLSLRYYNETSVIQVLLSVVGLAGLIYTLLKAWFIAPSDGSLHYLVFTGFSIVLAVLSGINLFLKSDCNGVSSNECFVSLFGLIIFPIVAVISFLKAWFVIPSDGYIDYLRFAGIWITGLSICAIVLVVLTFTHKNFKGDWLIFGSLSFFFLMEMIYSLQKTWNAMPNDLKIGIMVVALIIILLTGGAGSAAVGAGAGAYGHQSE